MIRVAFFGLSGQQSIVVLVENDSTGYLFFCVSRLAARMTKNF